MSPVFKAALWMAGWLAATLAMTATLDMPGSTHEIALSLDGRTAYASVYGDGVFAKRINPDRRIVVIDLPSKSLTRVIDLGDETCLVVYSTEADPRTMALTIAGGTAGALDELKRQMEAR